MSEDNSSKENEVCRLCEQVVPAEKFETHSIFCLIGNQCAIKITAIDEKLFDIINELAAAIYAASCYYLKGFVNMTSSEVSEDHLILSDVEFEIVKEIHKKLHQILKIHEFNLYSIDTLDNLATELETLCNSRINVFQKPLQDIVHFILNETSTKLAQLRSSYGACTILLDEDPFSVQSNEEFMEVAKNSFSLRYSDVMPDAQDFEIIKPISKGAFGQVFLAKKKRTGDYFAIKVQKKKHIFRKKSSKRVNDEHKILASTANPFIVKLYYSFESDDNLFLVMEYLPGGDCLSLLENLGCFSEEMTRVYIAETILALKYLHSYGIIHRDLKPDNMLINKDGHIKLTDFGLSIVGVQDYIPLELNYDQSKPQLKTRREKAFSCVGTPDYLAPEVLEGTGHNEAADWWSLGIITYEFLVGIPPFTSDSPEEVFENILHKDLVWPSDCEISKEAKDFVEELLQRNPSKRLGMKGEGAKEVMSHSFFQGIHWDSLLEQTPVFMPKTDNKEDTFYFDDRSETHKSVDINLNSFNLTTNSPNPRKFSRRRDFPTFQFRNLSHLAEQNTSIARERASSIAPNSSSLVEIPPKSRACSF